MPSPTLSLSCAAFGGSPCEAWISRNPLVGLMSTAEPLVARIRRTASRRINCKACWGSSVEWMTLPTWYRRLRRSYFCWSSVSKSLTAAILQEDGWEASHPRAGASVLPMNSPPPRPSLSPGKKENRRAGLWVQCAGLSLGEISPAATDEPERPRRFPSPGLHNIAAGQETRGLAL